MATIDLYGDAANQVRSAYKAFRPEGPSDDEVTKWLSGAYGHGDANNLQPILNAISNSDEARQRRAQPPQPPSSPFPSPFERPSQQPTPFRPIEPGQHTYGPMGVPQRQPISASYTDVDLQTLRDGIANVYRTSLGRDPGAGDVDKWLSGAYGHGSGPQDFNKFVSAIMGSDEARRYRPALTTGENDRKTIQWWQERGTPTIEIFDPRTGQLKPGWARTGNGYEWQGQGPPPGGTSNVPGPQGGNFQTWFLGLAGNGPSSPEALAALEPELNKRGIRLQKDSFGVIRGRIYLPDGSAVDVVPPNGWGQPWTWINRGTGGGGGAFGSNVDLPGAQFNDPHTKLLEELTLARIAALQSGNDPNLQRLMSFLEQRFGDLQGSGRTGAENEVIRTQALDPIERDRTAARQRALERLAARNITPDSGIAQQLLQEVDNHYDGLRAAVQRDLSVNELNRREGRQQHAESLAGALYDLPQTRAHEAIALAGNLSNLGPQRLQLAMQAANLGGSPAANMSTLLQLANLNQSAALLNSQDRAASARALGEVLYELFGKG